MMPQTLLILDERFLRSARVSWKRGTANLPVTYVGSIMLTPKESWNGPGKEGMDADISSTSWNQCSLLVDTEGRNSELGAPI